MSWEQAIVDGVECSVKRLADALSLYPVVRVESGRRDIHGDYSVSFRIGSGSMEEMEDFEKNSETLKAITEDFSDEDEVYMFVSWWNTKDFGGERPLLSIDVSQEVHDEVVERLEMGIPIELEGGEK